MKKILIIKMSALGDVMIALPHIDAITRHHQDDQVWILTGPQFASLFTSHPTLKVAVLDRRDKLFGNSTWAKIAWVRKLNFDCIYDLQGNRTSRLVVRFSGAARKVGTQPRPIYTHHPPDAYTRTTRQSAFDRLNQTLHAAGLQMAKPECTMYLSDEDRLEVINWKNGAGLDKDAYVILHAGGSREWPSKRWPAEHYAQLAGMIESSGVRCVWIGGPEESELNALLAGRHGIDATGSFTPLQLFYLGKGARFAVTNDSGPMHILANTGIPVYSFFGPTDWKRSHGAGQGERVLSLDLDCSPCFKGICPAARNHECLEKILPEDVFERITREHLTV